MELPAIASGRVNGLPVEQRFRLVEIRQGIDFIPIIRVEEDRFEEKRAGSTGQPRLVLRVLRKGLELESMTVWPLKSPPSA